METKDSGILQKEVNVVVSKAPVLSPIFESVEIGTSLRDIFNSYSGLSEQHTKIFVSGEEKSDWEYVVQEGDYVSVCQVPQEPTTIAIIAVVVSVVSMVAGYILYKSMDQPTGQGQGERLKRVTGARNEATPYEPIPVILGDRQVTPVYAAQPYTYWKGKEQWLKMLLCVGYGPLNISDIKIGDSPIWSFDDINYSVLDWNTTKSTSGIRSIWNKDIQQDVINQELGKENYISRSAPAGTDKITFEMVYPQGLWRTDDGDVGHSIGGFQFRYYVPGRGWYSVARIASSSSGYVTHQSVKKVDGRYYIVYSDKSSGAGNDLDFDITPWVDSERNGYAYIRDGSYGNVGYHYVNTQSYWHATRDELIKSWSFVPIDPITGAKLTGDVPFEVKRNGWDYDVNSAGFSTTLQLNTITYELAGSVPDSYFGIDHSLKRYPVLIALDVRASEQLSGVIDNLSCRAQSLIPQSDIYNDFKNFNIYGNWYTTNNPANMYKWMLQGPFNGAAVDNDRLDNSAIAAWESECYSRGWECNEIINEGINLKDLLNNIAFTGRAFFSMRDGKFSVIQNKAQSNPTQVFTTKNSRGLKSRREFDLETDGVKYTFANGDFQDQEDEGIYGDPDKFYNSDINRPKPLANITGRYEDFGVWGTTIPSLARKHARFAFFEKRLRREVYQLETDVESLIARRGDKVLLAHDVIDVGLGQGFIKEIDGNTFRIDETINLTAGLSYTLTIRSVSSGTQFYNTTATYQGDGWWSGSLPSYVEVGNLVAYGESGTQTLECLVTEITYSNNYEATLTLVNYADDLFTVDYGYLPKYESNLNPERPRDITPLAPTISVNYGSFTYESNAITVNVSQNRNDRALLSRFSLQYKYDPPEFDEEGEPIDIESDWQDGGVSPADDGTFRIPVSNNQGNVIYVRATAVNEAGVHSPFSVEKKIELQNDPAPDVEDFTVTEAVDTPKTPDARWSTLTIEITPPEVMNGYLYAIAEYRQPGQATWANIGTLGWRNPNSIDVQVYADGRQYEIRVRSASIYGVVNKNGLSKIITTTNTSDPEYTEDNPFEELPAPNVRGLELFDQGNDTEFTGRDAKFTWRKSTLNDWVDLGYEGLKGASNAVLDQYFRDYEVEIIANDEVVRTENVVDNIYNYTYEKNAEDYERRYGVAGAYRKFRISVIMRTRQNQESEKPSVLDVANPAPEPLTGIELIPGFRTITVSYNRPTDLDYQGVEVWVGNTSGFDVNDDTLVYDGPDTEVVIGGLETDTQYYIILRPYDAFGKVDIFSTELTATTLKIVTTDLDNTKPDTVTNVAATTAVYDSRLQSTSYIDVTWDAVTNTRIANYTIDINGDSQYTVAGTSFRFTDAIPGESYTFKVRANSFASIEGDFSTPITISAAVSSASPAVITNASVSGGLEKVVVEWTNPDSENFYSVGIYRGTTAGFTPSEANKIASVVGSVGSVQRSVDTDVVNGTTYYYKLIAETLGGVQGTPVDAGSATPFKISSSNVAAYFESAAIDQAYIGDLDANKITTGTLDAGRIGADTITSDKIDVTTLDAITANMGTLTAGKISVGNTTTGLELDTLNGIRAWNTGVQTLHFKPDGTGYIGASQDISWDGSGNVNISGELGAGSIFTNGQIKSVNGGVEVVLGPKDFGAEGVYLLSGTDSVGDLVFGVDENGNAKFSGDITGASGTFSGSLNINNNFVVDSSGNVDSSGTFRFGGSTEDYIEFDGTNLVIDAGNLSVAANGSLSAGNGFNVDASGNATFSGNLNGASGTFSGELQSATGVFGNKTSGKYIEFDGTDLIIGPESTIGNNNDITVTVGSTGDYATINKALEALSRTVPVYKSGGFNAEIQILTGTTISENIHVVGVDLGWITITHENGYTSRVQVDGSSVQDFFIKVEASGVGPNIDFPLEIINSNLSISSRIFYLVQGSKLTVNTSDLDYSLGADFIGRGITGDCVRCETGSIFESVGGMNIEDFGVGFVADNGSRIINGRSARLENCTTGIYIDNGSVLDSVNIRVSNVRDEVGEVRNSSFANLSSGVFLANPSFTRVAGIHCSYGSILNVSFATFNDFNYSPIRADFGGRVTAYQADTVDDNNRFLSGVTGIVVARGSTVSASLSTGTLSQTANTITSSGIIFR